MGLSSLNDKKFRHCQHSYANHDEIFTWVCHHVSMGLHGWSDDFPNKSHMAYGGHIEFRKMLNISVIDEHTKFAHKSRNRSRLVARARISPKLTFSR